MIARKGLRRIQNDQVEVSAQAAMLKTVVENEKQPVSTPCNLETRLVPVPGNSQPDFRNMTPDQGRFVTDGGDRNSGISPGWKKNNPVFAASIAPTQ